MAKSLPKKNGPVATASDRTPEVPRQLPIGDGEIARRAYALFQARGGEHGHDIEDWLQAERELRSPARVIGV